MPICKHVHRLLIVLQLLMLPMLNVAETHAAKNEDREYAMTEAELQGQVMAFADRYSAIISSAYREYLDQSPSAENRRSIHAQLVYSLADAFTIAAEPDPDVALLDMVVMVTLGRMVFEEHYTVNLGGEVAPLVKAFQKAERDIWGVADNVLNEKQLKELMDLIKDWRRNHSGVVIFYLLRFSDFESGRRTSGTSKSRSSGGLFQSVEMATAQVEEARLLAERGMYLGTRMPLLTGKFANVWLSSLAVNPDMKGILSDLHQVSEVSERLAVVAEDLPDKIAAERQAAIKQVMQEVAVERRAAIDQLVKRSSVERQRAINQLVEKVATERRRTIEEFVGEERRVRGLLTDLKQTLDAGNDVLTSTNTLVARFNILQEETSTADPSVSYDIRDYRAALQEATQTITQLHGLVKTFDQMGLEKTLPLIVAAYNEVEQTGEKWVLQVFVLGVLLIFIFLTGAVFAMVAYRYTANLMYVKGKFERSP
ncbi:hypothetical protein D3OALGA1CA_4948 [Olavius algarvensis associated proteobacterium Delta 3]|nr:hypothetical protein D3OALGA1CA_4948 [Olavius algarvensis associated proteobacterium Delta 3]